MITKEELDRVHEEHDKTQSPLTSRQWALKRFLEIEFMPNHYFSQEEICEKVIMPDGSKAYELNHDPYKHDKCIALSSDVRTINWSVNEGYKIIIKNSKGHIKLCESREEFEEWKQRELAPVTRKYQYLNNLQYKANLDGLNPLINQANNQIDYSKNNSHTIDVYAKIN